MASRCRPSGPEIHPEQAGRLKLVPFQGEDAEDAAFREVEPGEGTWGVFQEEVLAIFSLYILSSASRRTDDRGVPCLAVAMPIDHSRG